MRRMLLRLGIAAAGTLVLSAVLLLGLAAAALLAAGPRGMGPQTRHGLRPVAVVAPTAPPRRPRPVAALPTSGRRFALVASLAEARSVCHGEQLFDRFGHLTAQPVPAVVIIDPALAEQQELPPVVACGDL